MQEPISLLPHCLPFLFSFPLFFPSLFFAHKYRHTPDTNANTHMHSQTTHELHTTGVRLFVFDDCFFSFFFLLSLMTPHLRCWMGEMSLQQLLHRAVCASVSPWENRCEYEQLFDAFWRAKRATTSVYWEQSKRSGFFKKVPGGALWPVVAVILGIIFRINDEGLMLFFFRDNVGHYSAIHKYI